METVNNCVISTDWSTQGGISKKGISEILKFKSRQMSLELRLFPVKSFLWHNLIFSPFLAISLNQEYRK